jgi:FAD/FMN-containing dehydrogenase
VSATSTSTLVLSRLRSELDGQVIEPDSGDYEAARQVFSPLFDRRPAAIVRPVDAEEVGGVVSLAREHGLELAVRSGGHSPAGHGTTDGGIVLDLALMKWLDVDPDRRIARAQTGLTAGEVTAAIHPDGLAVGFGDTGSVGIGGLTLGGGVGYLVRKHGLTIDHLLAAEIVTGDGRLLRADAETNPDLFWAIRGGGGNFGVATRFEYRLHPVDQVTGGMLILPATPEVIAGFVEAAEEAPEELSTIANVMPAPPLPFVPAQEHGRPVVLATLVHAGSQEEGEEALAPFRGLAAPVADLVRRMPYPAVFPPEDPDFRPLGSARTLFLDAVDRDVAATVLDRLHASSAPMRAVQLRVLGGAMARVPDDATAFAHRRSRIMANVAAMYPSPAEAPTHEAWLDETATVLRQDDAGAYVNFLADEGAERVRAAYPGETWDRLTAVKRRYDPDNLFSLNQNIPPAAGARRAA